MKIEYKNYVAENYEVINHKDINRKIIIFRSMDTFSSKWEKTITLSADNINTEKLSTTLANAKTADDALKFTKKFGALVNTKLFQSKFPEKHNSDSILYAINDDYTSLSTLQGNYVYKYDYILYDHFAFYQYEIYHLIQINNMLSEISKSTPSAQFIIDLFNETMKLLFNPYFEDYIFLEYSVPTQEDVVNDSFPFIKLRYLTQIDVEGSIHDAFAQDFMDDALKLQLCKNLMIKFINEYPEEIPSSFNVKKLEKAFSNSENDDCYWLDSKTAIFDLAKSVFKDVLSFHMREINLPSEYSTNFANMNWQFPSLVYAIFFDFYIDITGGNTYKVCANKNCNKLFFCPASQLMRKKYCCKACAEATASRKYKQNQKEQTKSKIKK